MYIYTHQSERHPPLVQCAVVKWPVMPRTKSNIKPPQGRRAIMTGFARNFHNKQGRYICIEVLNGAESGTSHVFCNITSIYVLLVGMASNKYWSSGNREGLNVSMTKDRGDDLSSTSHCAEAVRRFVWYRNTIFALNKVYNVRVLSLLRVFLIMLAFGSGVLWNIYIYECGIYIHTTLSFLDSWLNPLINDK